MKAHQIVLCLALGARFACAQNPPPLEIRGTVVEAGFGVAGATVTLYVFGNEPAQATTRNVFATTTTDARGTFRLQPTRFGQYYIEVKKEGYLSADFEGHGAGPLDFAGEPVSLEQDHPSREFRFLLTRPGELRGRLIDEDGNPLARLRVVVHPPESSPSPAWAQPVTDQEGYFVADKLKPGAYLVRVQRQRGALDVLQQFTESDLKVVDQDFETSEWPGGGDEHSASPVPVSPGVSSSVGTITVRKTLYYRAHISVSGGDCAPGEKWNFAAIQPAGLETPFAPTLSVACTKSFLVRNLRPGSYMFALTSGRDTEEKNWALAPVEIVRENVEVALTMASGADLNGRVVAAEDAEVPRFGGLRINLMPDIQGFTDFVLFGSRPTSVDSTGRFLIRGLQGDRHRVLVQGLGGKYYVKEIRYSGLPAADGIITTAPGSSAQLEILVDDKAASITGLVTNGDKPASEAAIAVVKWPAPATSTFLSILMSAGGAADDQGRFQIDGLAPGEYRILALPREARTRLSPESFIPLLSRGEKVTVERGSSHNVSLKIVEP